MRISDWSSDVCSGCVVITRVVNPEPYSAISVSMNCDHLGIGVTRVTVLRIIPVVAIILVLKDIQVSAATSTDGNGHSVASLAVTLMHEEEFWPRILGMLPEPKLTTPLCTCTAPPL